MSLTVSNYFSSNSNYVNQISNYKRDISQVTDYSDEYIEEDPNNSILHYNDDGENENIDLQNTKQNIASDKTNSLSVNILSELDTNISSQSTQTSLSSSGIKPKRKSQEITPLSQASSNTNTDSTTTRSRSNTNTSLANSLMSPPKPFRRKRLDYHLNLAPSVKFDEDPFRAFDAEMYDKEVRQHAYMRVQLFALTVIALYGVVNPETEKNVTIKIGRAYMQIGKGTRQFHAAHANAAAGLEDDMRGVALQRLVSEGDATEYTKKLLAVKGFTDAEFRELQDNSYKLEKVAELFDKKWPVDISRPTSVFSGTRLEYILNSTSKLPASVNLFCDKSLEDEIRDKIEELYDEVMHSRITPQEACEEYCKLIWAHFGKLEPEVERRIECMEGYLDKLTSFVNSSLSEGVPENIQKLDDIHKEMYSTHHPAFKYSKMATNEEFLSQSLNKLQHTDKDPVAFIKNWIFRRKEEILKEAQVYSQRLKNYLRFSICEREGTKIPNFAHLLGPQEADDLKVAQKRLLAPMTPKKVAKSESTQHISDP